jgi:hypothetical protein
LIEIGSQREPQDPDDLENSTCFLDRLATAHDLHFFTVDFSKETHELTRSYVGDKAVLSDGAEFLRRFDRPISILYLDNFDVVYNDKHRESLMRRVGSAYDERQEVITNARSAEVHLEQVKAALPLLTSSAFIGFDDTMIKEGKWWGKGASSVPYLLDLGYKIVAHNENGLIMKKMS